MITVRLTGGLGNQMFQYAFGRRLSLELGVPLALDLGWFGRQAPQDTPRRYELGCFQADEHVTKVEVPLPVPKNRLELAWALLRERLGLSPAVVRQKGERFDPRLLKIRPGAHLVGYFQSERYFDVVADQIRSDFTMREPLSESGKRLLAEIESGPAISLHVRRGDYVTNPHANRFHGTLGPDYYRRALARIDVHEARLFVFSDDPDWCEAELDLDQPITVVRPDGRPAAEDVQLMSACDHHVIANSSFSWWGAWLDPNPAKTVVAPERWALDPRTDFRDVYPSEWLRA